jgi:hypothetical protein
VNAQVEEVRALRGDRAQRELRRVVEERDVLLVLVRNYTEAPAGSAEARDRLAELIAAHDKFTEGGDEQ